MKALILPILMLSVSNTSGNALLHKEAEQSSQEASTSQVQGTTSQSEQGVVDKAKDIATDILSKYFTPDKVAMIISWVTYAGTIIILAVKLHSALKQKNLTVENVKNAVCDAIPENIKPYMDKVLTDVNCTNEETKKILAVFSEILVLSQDNSPEARLAVLEAIGKLGLVGKETVEQSKEAVKTDIGETKKLKEDLGNIAKGYDGTKI